MINWYELPHKSALGFVLVIARSSNVIKMTAGKLFQLSIATFGDVSNRYITLKIIIITNKHLIYFFALYLSINY